VRGRGLRIGGRRCGILRQLRRVRGGGGIPFSDVKCGKGQCRKLEDRLEGIKTIKIKEKTYLPSPILHIANFIV